MTRLSTFWTLPMKDPSRLGFKASCLILRVQKPRSSDGGTTMTYVAGSLVRHISPLEGFQRETRGVSGLQNVVFLDPKASNLNKSPNSEPQTQKSQQTANPEPIPNLKTTLR